MNRTDNKLRLYVESTKVPGGTWLQPVQSIPNL
eukprot:SAG31_NODE_20122_length_583_cov_0.933884_1_plen_32_part_10